MSRRSSRPCNWVSPRPYSDPSLRLQTYGAIHPMERPAETRVLRVIAKLVSIPISLLALWALIIWIVI